MGSVCTFSFRSQARHVMYTVRAIRHVPSFHCEPPPYPASATPPPPRPGLERSEATQPPQPPPDPLTDLPSPPQPPPERTASPWDSEGPPQSRPAASARRTERAMATPAEAAEEAEAAGAAGRARALAARTAPAQGRAGAAGAAGLEAARRGLLGSVREAARLAGWAGGPDLHRLVSALELQARAATRSEELALWPARRGSLRRPCESRSKLTV